MTILKNIDARLLNKSEIARRMNVTPEYVQMLFNGKRTNKKRIIQINSIVKKILKAA
jgi:hypothetical protein